MFFSAKSIFISVKTSWFLVITLSNLALTSLFTSFLRIASFANTFVTSASETTCFNSFLISATSFSSFIACSSFSFFSSNFFSDAWALASVTTVLNACTVFTCSSTSSFVAVLLANTTLAFSKTSRAVSTAVLSASWADFNFSSSTAILSFRIFLSTFSSTFVATAEATLSLVFSTTGLEMGLGSSVDFWSAFVVFSASVLFATSSLACATAPTPKKILAPITTDAAPTLNFLIEYDSTLVPCLVSFKYRLFLLTIYFLLIFKSFTSNYINS